MKTILALITMWGILSFGTTYAQQAPSGLEVDKGKCMASILLTARRMPSNVGPALVSFERKNRPRLDSILASVGKCVGTNTQSSTIHATCAKKLAKKDFEFYHGYSLIVSNQSRVTEQDLLGLGFAMCAHLVN